jgi:hypothetical protein
VTCDTFTDVISLVGRAVAQAVSRWLPTAAVRVRARVWQVGFVVDKAVSEQVFSEYFDFPCQNHFNPPTFPSSQSPGPGTQRPCDELITRPRSPADSADCPRSSDRNETQSFMEAAKAHDWAVDPEEKKINLISSGIT